MSSNSKLLGLTSSNSDSIHANFLRESKEDVFKKYEVIEILGQGSMGYVSKVKVKSGKVGGSAFQPKINGPFPKLRGMLRKKPTNTLEGNCTTPVYALKMIQLDRISPMFVEELKNEIAIMRTMDHPNIVKATEVYLYRKQIYIIMEACDGGDLYTRSPYSERQAATYMSQLCSAINYMHRHGIVHRDLKYENIMFETNQTNSEVKVIDFGLSKKFLGDKPGVMTDRVGTVYTMAPQVLQGIYSSQADLWSLGVIAYMLLSASKPFMHKRRRKMIDMIMRGAYHFDAPVWDLISTEAKDFVSKLLVVDPKIRLNAKQALEHEWIVNREKLSDEVPAEDVLMAMPESLLRYKDTSNLKKLALNVIAHRSTADEIVHLRKTFEAYDTERNGVISYEEFKAALEKAKYSEDSILEIFESIDVNKNGHINYTEFLAATMEAHGHIEERRIAEAFDRLDSDDSGFISKSNLKELLGSGYSKKAVDDLVADADTDGDGRISYPEFLALFRKQTQDRAGELGRLETGLSDAASEKGLMGLDAKIPGGRYDSNLPDSLKQQLRVGK
ncbi:hypothetical protein ACA910_018413 [Epithemia clementina (nom. ined.)]